MRTGLTNESLERAISNDRVTIAIRRDDLEGLGNVCKLMLDHSEGNLEVWARILEVITIALRSQ